MKHVLMFSCLFLFGQSLKAQSNDIAWFTNMETATTYANEHQQNILMVFAGSDWCRPCMQFKKDILEDDVFKQAAKDKLVVLYLDFPARKKNKLSKEATQQNEALAERFNKSGAFPNIILLDSDEKVLANPSYKRQSADEFLSEVMVEMK